MASRWSMPPSPCKGEPCRSRGSTLNILGTVDPASQNTIERYLLTWLGLAVPRGVRLILIFDRGYARVELIKDLKHGQQPFLIRGRRNENHLWRKRLMVNTIVDGTFRQTNLTNESFEYLAKREELRLAEIELMRQRE